MRGAVRAWRRQSARARRPFPAAAAAPAQQVFDDPRRRAVVPVGAGKMSELTARNLRSRGAVVTAVANRTAARRGLAQRLGSRAVGLDEVAEELARRRS